MTINPQRAVMPRQRHPAAQRNHEISAGIDRIPSLEKRLSQCGDDAMRACRCFPRSTVFKQTRLNGRGPTRRNHVDSCQNRTSGLRSPVIEAHKTAGHGARARSVMGRWSYRALASPMIPAYRGSRRTCGVAMPVAPQTGGSPVACSISHALAFFVERVLGRTWRGVRLTEGAGSSIGADGASTEEVSLFGLFSSER